MQLRWRLWTNPQGADVLVFLCTYTHMHNRFTADVLVFLCTYTHMHSRLTAVCYALIWVLCPLPVVGGDGGILLPHGTTQQGRLQDSEASADGLRPPQQLLVRGAATLAHLPRTCLHHKRVHETGASLTVFLFLCICPFLLCFIDVCYAMLCYAMLCISIGSVMCVQLDTVGYIILCTPETRLFLTFF